MSNLKLASALSAAVGALCLLLVQFLPWAGVETEGFSGFGFDFPGAKVDSYTWQMDANGQNEGWYNEDFDDSDGIGMIRTAIPFLLAGLVVTAIGAVVCFLRASTGGLVTLIGGVVALVGLVLFAMGTDSFYDSNQDWGASFYLAIAGTVLGLLGGVLGLLSGNASSRTTA